MRAYLSYGMGTKDSVVPYASFTMKQRKESHVASPHLL